MNIKKILKFYLVLTLILSGASLVNSNLFLKEHVSGYMATVFNAFGELNGTATDKNQPVEKHIIKTAYSAETEFVFIHDTLSSSLQNLVDFKIENNPAAAYASPGAKQVKIMDFYFKAKDNDLNIGNIKLKAYGAQKGEIQNAYISLNDQLISTAEIDGEYLEFSDLNYLLSANNEVRLTFKLDLSDSVKIGTRIRLDLESTDDLSLKLNEENFSLQSDFPIKGKYLSISRSRFHK